MRLCILLVFFYAKIALAANTNCEVSELDLKYFLKMDFYDFDQSEKGWRLLVAKSCFSQAAIVQEKYRKANFNRMLTWERRTSSWHIGQVYAFDRNYSKAIKYFKKSINLNEDGNSSFRWNDYVDASIAFLEKDRKKLNFYRMSLYKGKSPYNRMNLRIVDSFLRCFDSPYMAAYSLDCHPRETEKERLRATAIKVESLTGLSNPLIEYIKNHEVIAIGEIHGNQESLDLFGGLVKALSDSSGKILVALEIPSSEQSRVNQFLKTLNVDLLRKSEFFSGQFQDGRASKAMLGLLQKLSKIKNINVLCFDYVGDGDSQARDNQMAKLLYDKIGSQNYDHSLILTGSVHASLKIGTSWDLSFIPMLRVLDEDFKKSDSPKRLLNIGLKYKKLKTWACFMSGCGAHEINQPESAYSEAVSFNHYFTLEDDVVERGYMSSFFIRETTASFPIFYIN